MKKVMKIFGAMFIASVILTSCSNKAQVSLEKVLQITGNTFNGACKVGNVYGNATINFNGEKVSVNYSAMGYSATASGVLENLKLVDDGENNTYSITGDWNNQASGDGHFRIEVFGADEPNTIYLAIEGSSWKYYDSKELSDEDFNKFITVLYIDLNTTSSSEADAIKEDTNQKSTAIVENIVNDDNTEYYIIEDPDGYSNLREVPSGNVIRKVYVGEKFEILGEENNYKKVKFSDSSTGYIHNSRVVNFNDKVCECLHSADEMIKKDLDKDFSTGSETGFSDNWNPSYKERLVEIFRYNQCPKGCDFLGDHDVIDFQNELQRCSE